MKRSTKNPHGIAALALLTMVASALSTSTASADDPGRDEPVTPGDAIAIDARTYAAETGVSHEVATRRMHQQAQFGIGIESLAQEYAETFAGAWVKRGDPLEGVILFVGQPPAGVGSRSEFRDINVEVRGGAYVSREQLARQSRDVHRELLANGYSEVATSFDAQTGLVHIDVVAPPDQEALSDSERRRRLPDGAKRSNVRTYFVPGSHFGVDHTYGGARLEAPGSETLSCTTAFSVTKNGATGVLTAGHCVDDLDYNESNGNEYRMSFESYHEGIYGDYQWHTTSHSEYPEFYSDYSTRRTYKSDATSYEGAYICRFGHKTGYKCDYVYRVWITKSWTSHSGSHTSYYMVAMTKRQADKGDSGGPWFNGGNGYGVHHGPASVGGVTRDAYSEITYADNGLGVFTILG